MGFVRCISWSSQRFLERFLGVLREYMVQSDSIQTMCSLSLDKLDVGHTLHFVLAKPPPKNSAVYQQRHHYHNMHQNRNHINHHFITSYPHSPCISPSALSCTAEPIPRARIEPLAACRFSRNTR